MAKRKPPRRASVVALNGEFKNAVVTQEQLREIADAQAAAWAAHSRATKLAQRAKAALNHGATIEPGRFYFDPDLEMVRSRRSKQA